MDLIGTRLGDDTDDSAAVATVLRRVIAGQQSELGDGIGIGIEQVAVIQQVVVVAAIEQEGHGIGSSAGDAVTARAAVVVVALGDAGLKQSQIEHVAPVQGHVGESSTGDRLSQSWVDGFDGSSLGTDIDGLTLGAHFHLEIDAERLVDQQLLLGAVHLAKTSVLGGHLVVADGQAQQLVDAFLVRGCLARILGVRVGHGNLYVGDHQSLLVVDRSKNSSGGILRPRDDWHRQHHQQQ